MTWWTAAFKKDVCRQHGARVLESATKKINKPMAFWMGQNYGTPHNWGDLCVAGGRPRPIWKGDKKNSWGGRGGPTFLDCKVASSRDAVDLGVNRCCDPVAFLKAMWSVVEHCPTMRFDFAYSLFEALPRVSTWVSPKFHTSHFTYYTNQAFFDPSLVVQSHKKVRVSC